MKISASKIRKNYSSFIQKTDLRNCTIIAVTGQMASGKNYVCSLLEAQDWLSIDCDVLVHKAVIEAAPVIIKTFEPYAREKRINIQNQDGSVNRRAIGQLVFSDKKLLEMQEAIVYPLITKMVEDFISANKDKKIILNATVLYKTPVLLQKCDAIMFVKAAFPKRLLRARKRDKMPFSQIFKRFYNQKDLLNQYKLTKKPIILIKN